jgi:hypothetical protein
MKWNEQQEWDGGEGVTVEVKVQVSFKILGSVLESSCKDAGDGRGHREGVTGTRLEGRTRRKATMLREVRERPPLQARRFTRMGPITCPIALHGLFSGASWGAPQLIPTRPTLQEIIQSALTGGQGPSGLRQPNPDSKGGGLFWRESRTLTPKRPPGWTTPEKKNHWGYAACPSDARTDEPPTRQFAQWGHTDSEYRYLYPGPAPAVERCQVETRLCQHQPKPTKEHGYRTLLNRAVEIDPWYN